MKLDARDLEHVAQLAGLRIRPDQLEQMVGDVRDILEFVSTIAKHPEPHRAFRPGPACSPLRPDLPTPDRCITALEGFVPETREGFILAPRPPGVEP